MVDFTDAELQVLEAGVPRFGLFLRLESNPIVRMWLGVGDIRPGVNLLDPVNGGTYRGYGQIIDLPTFQQIADGTAQRLSFTVSPIPPAALDEVALQISAQQTAIAGKSISCGYALMGSEWQLIGPVHWTWNGIADYLTLTKEVSQSPSDSEQWTLALSAGGWLTGKRRPSHAYFTQADQAARSAVINPGAPTDRFCERTPLYSEDTDKTWPHFPT